MQSTWKKQPGRETGLAVSRGIIADICRTIRVNSEVGKEQFLRKIADMNKGRVLIIDDEEIVCVSCQRILTPEGYEVKTTTSAAEGLSILAKEPVDIVLTDFKMPDVDGLAVLKKVKEQWPDIEVIMITGYHTITTAAESIRKLGAFDYIEKPFSPDAIVEAIEKAMTHKKRQV